MLAYLFRRLFAAAVMLVVIIMVVFGIFFLVPKWAGVDIASSFVGKQADPAAVEAVRQKLGLSDPIYSQVWEFFKGIFAGRTYAGGGDVTHCAAPCFGYSFRSEQAIWPVLTDRFPVTLALALGAAVLWLVLGMAAGVLSALKRGSFWDRGAMVVALAGVSLPVYFTGMASLAVFAFGLDWLDARYVPLTDSFTGWFGGLILPWITLAFLYAAMYARITRATMLEILGEDYIRTARAKGLREQTVIGKHAMRSTMTPILTMLGMDLGALIGGAILTETTFNLPGLGQAVLNAIKNQDLPVILGVTLITSLAVLIANLVVDVLYAVIDPRVRLA
ncbi:ABC transporter permease [Streptomyces griseoviridis]|uniref:ABC transporter permease n=3 Tax=Streptomyces TaxID=1883 RepID=A0A918GTH9_STRGD|nr:MULTISPECIES: ABC transporter permease [Streptomyces]MDP9684216.1 peptide/nickel transport system permease protein [Streptomyces griseoviridis]GGS59510.1 ABC transporter permease [Streptomyces niveoruber]GGT02167.1 ABC transporter permease [Streptomyces griseoviridis]GGU39461.1 ABC transporter permease [Streptomyces daghestanicus]GHI30826.1 ABC transporter permease [Streptomyces daghestanicus]